jgi:hypothetical protein
VEGIDGFKRFRAQGSELGVGVMGFESLSLTELGLGVLGVMLTSFNR